MYYKFKTTKIKYQQKHFEIIYYYFKKKIRSVVQIELKILNIKNNLQFISTLYYLKYTDNSNAIYIYALRYNCLYVLKYEKVNKSKSYFSFIFRIRV